MIVVDGRPVAPDAAHTVLDACRTAGAHVPTLCHDARVEPRGHCRACLVDVDGRLVPACTTPAHDGQRIATDTPALAAYRRDLCELMLAESAPRGAAAALCAATGADGTRYPPRARDGRADDSHPYLRFDLEACIKCRLCVQVCEDVQGQFVYAFAGRGEGAHLSWGDGVRFADTDCVACGACASACPSGAIDDVDRRRATSTAGLRTVRTTCGYCGVGCQLDVRTDGTDVVQIDGTRAASVNAGHLCVKGRYAHRFVGHPDRLTTPLVRRGGRRDAPLVPAGWDEALDLVARKMDEHRGKVAALSSSRCTNEENYLLQKWLRAGLATHNVDCCARVCHGPTAAGMRRVLGTGAATNSLADIAHADVILVSGSNATVGHPVTGARIKQAVLRGARLIVIDPRRTELAAIADAHLQLRPGSNVALLNSLACALFDLALENRAFLAARTTGAAELRAFVAQYAPERAEALTGVPAALVRRAAALWGNAERPYQAHGLGMTEHFQGSESVMLLCNLSLLVGGFGREGVGVNPLRGQNNVQGAADMGCQPDLLTGYADPADPAVRERFTRVWGRPLPTDRGLTIPKMYRAAARGDVRALFILGEDVVQTDPAAHVDPAFAALDFIVVQEIFLSKTAERADVVLPGACFFEKDGTFTNGERRIQRVRKVVEPPPGARADWQILCELMARTGLPQPFAHPSDVMDEIAQVAPPFAGVSFARLEGDGLQWPVPDAAHPGTGILHAQAFPVGKAVLPQVQYVPSPVLANAGGEAAYPLRLVTGRVLEHYNCGTMTRRTDAVRLVAHDALEIHPDDARALGVVDGAPVRVVSAYGEARAHAALTEAVAPGTCFLSFHFPETGTNDVTSDVVDRVADCPEYKLTPVRVEPIR